MIGTLHRVLTISRNFPEGSGVLERLGRVIYWAGCGLAGLVLVLGVFVAVVDVKNSAVAIIVALVAAGVSWGVGRGAYYVLGGR